MRRAQKDRAAKAQAGGLHISGAYRRNPWGHLGMGVKIYPARVDGSLWKLVSMRGTIATAKSSHPLTDLARRERWVAEYPQGR
jgi:hypothetical protein